MKSMNIYLCGVGGQGIGLLSEVMIRTAVAAGYEVMGADTHGLAQRGGTVVSHLRIGEGVFTPRVPPGQADLVLALERIEGLRGMEKMLKPGGTLIYYNTVYQPIGVRTNQDRYPSAAELEQAAERIGAHVRAVDLPDLDDPRMQNVALLGALAAGNYLARFDAATLEGVLRAVVPPKVIDLNLDVFYRAWNAGEQERNDDL